MDKDASGANVGIGDGTLRFYASDSNAAIGNSIAAKATAPDFRLGVGITSPSERVSVSDGFRETACLKSDGAIWIAEDLTLDEAKRTIAKILEAWRLDVTPSP